MCYIFRIELILTPKMFSVTVNETGYGIARLSGYDYNYMTRLQAGAIACKLSTVLATKVTIS